MMEENPQIELARKLIESTRTHLFLTGRAGTGKTTFLRNLRQNSPKRMVVLAPTGIAAINAGGVTIHSFFQLPFAPFIYGTTYAKQNIRKITKQKKQLIQSLDLLVIDEISMVRADLLDAVDDALRHFRNWREPFGGVQLLLIGDLQQLAPVTKDEEWNLLKNYYSTPYFFSSKALQRTNFATIELQKVYRQADSHFLSLLNNIREGITDKRTLDELNMRCNPNFVPNKKDGYIRLVTHNIQAQQINNEELSLLQGKEYTFKAHIQGNFSEYSYPTDSLLMLKKGAQIMFIKNDPEHRFYNGMIGEVGEIHENGFQVHPHCDPQKSIDVKPERWDNTHYSLNEKTKEIEEIVDGTFKQYPVKLAWAITIHKSQGLTFENVIIDASHSFASGQTYVALSRCKTLEGIVLTSPIQPSSVIIDNKIKFFTTEIRNKSIDSQELKQMQNDFAINLLTELFTFEKERTSFSQIERILQEFLSNTYPSTVANFTSKLQAFDLEIMSVSSRFYKQYQRLLADNNNLMENDILQERITKGAQYFLQKLKDFKEVAKTALLETDNVKVSLRLKTALVDLQKQILFHTRVLEDTIQNGFHTTRYLNIRAKAMLEIEDASLSHKKKKDKKEVSPIKKNKKQNVPDEVKNAILYNYLKEWRKQKAIESGLPAFLILQTKALIAIANQIPQTPQDLLRIPNFGKVSFNNYGKDILKIVSNYIQKRENNKE